MTSAYDEMVEAVARAIYEEHLFPVLWRKRQWPKSESKQTSNSWEG